MAMRRKPTVCMNCFNCISRMMIGLTFSLESFSYTLLGLMRKLYTLEVSLMGRFTQVSGWAPWWHPVERAQYGTDSGVGFWSQHTRYHSLFDSDAL